VFVGSILEETFSPIPSFLVLVPAGAALLTQGHTWWYLIVLAIIASAGRTIGALVVYFLADKIENLVFRKRRTLFGISHAQVERVGKTMATKRKTRLWSWLFTVNAVPIFPTTPVLLTAGFIKIPLKLFLTATFCGSIFNALFYLLIGYFGLSTTWLLDSIGVGSNILLIACLVAGAIWLWVRYKRKSQR
jgi:membrane protein DedA with SNARE-associated domain